MACSVRYTVDNPTDEPWADSLACRSCALVKLLVSASSASIAVR